MTYKLLSRMALAIMIALVFTFTAATNNMMVTMQDELVEGRLGAVRFSTISLLIATIQSATAKDTILLVMHSPGGNVYAGFQIIDKLIATDAKTVGFIPQACYSMCAMITLHMDKIRLAPDAKIMFHMYHYQGYKALPGTWLSKIDPSMNDYFISSFKLMKEKGLLTDLEYRGILKGYDIYISGSDYNKRLERIGR